MVWKENRKTNIKLTVNNSDHMNANLVLSDNWSQTIRQYNHIKASNSRYNTNDQRHNNSPREETYR
jgi:hypothetical protein